MEKIKVFIIDDQIDFIKGILHLFRNDSEIEIIGYETQPDNFFEKINPSKFDVLLVDIKMPNTNGIELIKKLIIRFPYIKAIIFSMYYDFDKLQEALGVGAKGYVVKNSSKAKIQEAIREVYANHSFFHLDQPDKN